MDKPLGRNRRQLIMVRLNGAEKAGLESLVEQFNVQFPGATWTQSDVMRNALAELHRCTFHTDIPPLKRTAEKTPRDLLNAALSANRVVFSIMGSHAGESADAIFLRKRTDIAAAGNTFWLYRSPSARPDKANAFLAEESNRFVIFLAALQDGARATTTAAKANEFSSDNSVWTPLPEAISPVTGKLPAYAFSFAELDLYEELIDLGKYVTTEGASIRFRLGASTQLATRTAPGVLRSLPSSTGTNQLCRMIAIGRLATPSAVWIR